MARTIASAAGKSVFRVNVPLAKLALYRQSSDDATSFARRIADLDTPESTPSVTTPSTRDASAESDPDFNEC